MFDNWREFAKFWLRSFKIQARRARSSPEKRSSGAIRLSSIPAVGAEPILVDFQRADFRFERGSGLPQFRGRSFRSSHTAAAFVEGRFDHSPFVRRHAEREFNFALRFRAQRLLRQPTMVDRKSLRVA